MPEGDTLYRIAATIRPALQGSMVTLDLPRVPFNEAGLLLQKVQSFGKHLLLHFEDGRVLNTHLKMTGIWHVYSVQQPWRRPARDAVVVVGNGALAAVCFRAPTVQLLAPLAARRLLATLATTMDILDPEFDSAAAARALQQCANDEIGVALLNQAVIAGIGNVYKSEGLFTARIHPLTTVAKLPIDDLTGLIRIIAQMMRRNVADMSGDVAGVAAGVRGQPQYRYQRTTRSGCEVGKGPIAVYGRMDRNCFECGVDIRMIRQGAQQRSSYFCPQCQRL